jgi:hypothetical protein
MNPTIVRKVIGIKTINCAEISTRYAYCCICNKWFGSFDNGIQVTYEQVTTWSFPPIDDISRYQYVKMFCSDACMVVGML